MSRKGVIIGKGLVGANKLNRLDMISAIIGSGPAIAGEIALGDVIMVTSLKEAEAKGITAAYDAAANVRIHRHVSEFYRGAGDGVELYIQLYPQTLTPVDALGATYAQKLITEARGRVRQLAVVYNPESSYVAAAVDGMDGNVRLAIPAAQVLADWAYDTFRPLHVILEGRGISATAATAINLRGIVVEDEDVEYNQVSLMIGQDYDYAELQDALGKKFADAGTLLGVVAACKVNENPGEVGTRNITDTVRSKWLTAGISSHTKISTIEADLEDWDEKGYILAWDYQSDAVSGYRINNDHVCAPIVEDADGNLNEHSIALSRTTGKVARRLRDAYLPKVNSTQPVDPATGKLPIGIIKYLEGIGNNEFANMAADGEISGGVSVVDPESNLLSGNKVLNVGFKYTPTGTIGEINGVVNIKSSL